MRFVCVYAGSFRSESGFLFSEGATCKEHGGLFKFFADSRRETLLREGISEFFRRDVIIRYDR